jgi:hypothetical protein
MAARPANKGAASMRRAGRLADADTVAAKPAARQPRSGPRRIQDAQTVDDALEIERDTGRAEGVKSNQKRPITRYGPAGKPRADAPPTATKSAGDRARSALGSGGAAHDGAGVLLGMVTYALFLAYVKGGWSGVTGWLAAKFTNKTKTDPIYGPGQAPGGSTITPKPGGGIHVTPGPGDLQPIPWGTVA